MDLYSKLKSKCEAAGKSCTVDPPTEPTLAQAAALHGNYALKYTTKADNWCARERLASSINAVAQVRHFNQRLKN